MYPGFHAANEPDKPAIIMAATGNVLTYADLDAEANRVSQLFYALGLRPGDHVAFCMENHERFLPLAWGAHYAGLIYTALSSRLTTEEMEYIISNCEAKVFVTSMYKADQAAELVDLMPGVSHRFMIDGVIEGYDGYEDAIAAQPATPLENRVAGADMLYSSGTTGKPKGVLPSRSVEPLETATHSVGAMQALVFGMSGESVYLSPAPLYHAAPLRFCMGTHTHGGTVIVMDRFEPEAYLAALEKYKATHTQVVPTMFVRMLKLDPDVRAKYDVSSMQACIHAAAPCPIEVKEQMIQWWGPVIHEYYAGTEGNGFVYCNSEMWLAHKGTVGFPIGCTIHIVGEDGEEVPQGEEGTIYFEGGGEFEYHGDPEKTAGSRHPKGWTTLGDVGRLDEDGFLYLTDRKAYMIITGGVNVYPQEAENILTMHPKVFDVAVIGVPNADFGEEVKAIVQLVPEVEPSDAVAAELIAYCREHLADVKCPRSVDFRDELPRHPTGKLYKRLLKDEYWQGHTSRII